LNRGRKDSLKTDSKHIRRSIIVSWLYIAWGAYVGVKLLVADIDIILLPVFLFDINKHQISFNLQQQI
jgi:hypothetical protein